MFRSFLWNWISWHNICLIGFSYQKVSESKCYALTSPALFLEEGHKAKKIQVDNVKFVPGASNKLHTHTTEQILIITEGKGIVATKNQEHIVTPGMIILVSPGEEH